MKLLHHLIPITLAACGTASSSDPIGCTSDLDCKGDRICLEGICGEERDDTGIIDSQPDDATPEPQQQAIIYTVARVHDGNVLLTYNLGANRFDYMKDKQDRILSIPNLVSAQLSPSGNIMAYLTEEGSESYKLSIYNLTTGNNKVVATNKEGSFFHFGNEDEFFYTRFGTRPDQIGETAIYKVKLNSMENHVKVLSFPLKPWALDFAVEPAEKKIAFACAPEENIEKAKENPNDPSIYSRITLCLTDYNTIHPEQYRYFKYGLEDSLEMVDVDLIWDRYPQGKEQYDPILKIFIICQENDSVGLCASIHPNNIGVVHYFFGETYSIVPNEDHSQILVGDVIYDRAKSTPGNPSLYRIRWNNNVEGKEIRAPGTVFGFKTKD